MSQIEGVLTLFCINFAVIAVLYTLIRVCIGGNEYCDGVDCDTCPFPRCHPLDQDEDI